MSFVLLAADALGQACTCSLCCLVRDVAPNAFADRERPAPTREEVVATGVSTGGTQVVFLDFDSRTSFLEREADLGYTAFERHEIVNRVRADYELFDFEFVLEQPTSGDFTTIFMNDGPAFGIAEQIDFRNVDRNDNATVNVPFSAAPNDYTRVLLTSTTISHELGHILGLRHADAFGPIGSGINVSSFAVFGFDFPGPSDASESGFHIMQTDANNGVPFETFFGEREAVKLSFNERGVVVAETATDNRTVDTAEAVQLQRLDVPDTVRAGQFSDGQFEVDALTVLGSLESGTVDVYSFEAAAGDVLNVEVLSTLLNTAAGGLSDRYPDSINPGIRILDSAGEVLDFFGAPATNDLGTEGTDAIVIDLMIPETGTYFVEVNAEGQVFPIFDEDGNEIGDTSDGSADSGDYELFIYTFGVDTGTRATSAGDFNGDGIVDAADFSLFRDTLGQEVAVGSGADGNANGLIDPEDYRYWLGNYGRADSGLAAIPEPSSMLILVVAVSGLAAARRG